MQVLEKTGKKKILSSVDSKIRKPIEFFAELRVKKVENSLLANFTNH